MNRLTEEEISLIDISFFSMANLTLGEFTDDLEYMAAKHKWKVTRAKDPRAVISAWSINKGTATYLIEYYYDIRGPRHNSLIVFASDVTCKKLQMFPASSREIVKKDLIKIYKEITSKYTFKK